MDDIFNQNSHYSYLQKRFKDVKGRGLKKNFSLFIGIQPAYLSQILNEKASLSLEQADKVNQYFEHSEDESRFFLLLVSRDRSGTPSLIRHFSTEIDRILEKRKRIMEHLGQKPEVSEQTKGAYYSSWLYAAVHVGCTISTLQTQNLLAKHFQISSAVIGRILDFLEENSFLQKVDERYLPTENWVRLKKDSPYIVKHHTNWRLQAIQNLEKQSDDDLHYSGIFSLDKKTADSIKVEFMNCLKNQVSKIEKSQEEELYIIGLDFFKR